MIIINRNNAMKAACFGGCVYWILIFVALSVDLLTASNSKAGMIHFAVIFSTFVGVAFYTMIFWTMLKPIDEPRIPLKWTLGEAILGFSPVPLILLGALVILEKLVS